MLRHPAEVSSSRSEYYNLRQVPGVAGWINVALMSEQLTAGSPRVLVRYGDLTADWRTQAELRDAPRRHARPVAGHAAASGRRLHRPRPDPDEAGLGPGGGAPSSCRPSVTARSRLSARIADHGESAEVDEELGGQSAATTPRSTATRWRWSATASRQPAGARRAAARPSARRPRSSPSGERRCRPRRAGRAQHRTSGCARPSRAVWGADEEARPDHRHRPQRHQHDVGHAPPPGPYVPGPYLGANKSNPKGFFESKWAIAFHKRITTAARHRLLRRPPSALERARAAVTPELRRELVDFLREQAAEHDQVVVKDPRTVWAHDVWREAAAEAGLEIRYISMLRHPAEVVGSRRTYYAKSEDPADIRRYENINVARWVNNSLISEHETRGHARAFVRYVDLLTDWRPVAQRPRRRPRADVRRRRHLGGPARGRRVHRPRPPAPHRHLGRPGGPRRPAGGRGGDLGRPRRALRRTTARTPRPRPTSTGRASATTWLVRRRRRPSATTSSQEARTDGKRDGGRPPPTQRPPAGRPHAVGRRAVGDDTAASCSAARRTASAPARRPRLSGPAVGTARPELGGRDPLLKVARACSCTSRRRFDRSTTCSSTEAPRTRSRVGKRSAAGHLSDARALLEWTEPGWPTSWSLRPLRPSKPVVARSVSWYVA